MIEQIIDSNILLAVVRQEAQREEGENILLNGAKNIIPYSVLSEVYSVLQMRESHTRAVQTMNWILEDPMFEMYRESNADFIDTVYFLRQTSSPLSFVDAQLFCMSKRKGIPLQTFDKALQKEIEK